MFSYESLMMYFRLIKGNGPKLCYAIASDTNEKDNVKFAVNKCCKTCYYSDRESDGSYYCDYHRYHVSPDGYCGYWK